MDTLYPVNAVAGAPAYSGRMLRQANSVFLAGATAARPLGARSGVRPGTSTATVTATSTTWTCGTFAGVIDGEAAAEAAAYTFSFDAVATGAMTAANASNPRVDIIYVQVDDPSESDGTSVPAVRRGYLAGVAAATPTAPAAPARSFVVAQINVPKSGGGAPTVSWVAPYAVGAGGILPIDTLVNLNSIPGAPGQHAYVYGDTFRNGDYVSDGATWALAAKAFTASTTRATTDNYATGQVTLSIDATITNAPPGKYHLTGRVILKSTQANAGTISYLVNGATADSATLDVGTVVTHVPVDYLFTHPGGNLTVGVADNRTAGTATVYAGSRLTVVFVGV